LLLATCRRVHSALAVYTGRQMDLEESQRKHIEDLKSAEKQAAEREVYAALSKFQPGAAAATTAAAAAATLPTTAASTAQPTTPSASTTQAVSPATAASTASLDESGGEVDQGSAIWASSDDGTAPVSVKSETTSVGSATAAGSTNGTSKASDGVDEDDVAYIPPPRSCRTSVLSFTPRTFPTPMRESTAREEEDWLAKNKFKVLGTGARTHTHTHSAYWGSSVVAKPR
jgi:dyslexia susceptibility 1 candidate gene 1 protein